MPVRIDSGQRALTALSLKVRIRIRAELRRYSDSETAGLWELFGPREEWGRSLGPLPWASLDHQVGPFLGTTTTEVRMPCAAEPGAAAPKYLAAIEDGVVPIELLFSGTLSWTASGGRPCTALIPWDRDASFRVPPAVWRLLELER